MSDLFWLTEAQIARLEPYFPKSHGKPRVDDRRILSGIVFLNCNGLRRRDAPKEYGPHGRFTAVGSGGATRAFLRRCWLAWSRSTTRKRQ
jgi:transposase